MVGENNMVINLLEQEAKHQENLKEIHALVKEKQLGKAEAIIAKPYDEELHHQIKASIQILKQNKSKDAHIEALEANIRKLAGKPMLSVGSNDPITFFSGLSPMYQQTLGFIKEVLEGQLIAQNVLAEKGDKLSLGVPYKAYIGVEYDERYKDNLSDYIRFLDGLLGNK